MTHPLKLVVVMAIVTWLLIVVASLVRVRGWTPKGLWVAFGNREGLSEPGGFAGRLDRAAKNTFENFVLFAALVLSAHALQGDAARVALGANIFFYARLVYIPVYGAGIAMLRTAVWSVSVVGLGLIVAAVL